MSPEVREGSVSLDDLLQSFRARSSVRPSQDILESCKDRIATHPCQQSANSQKCQFCSQNRRLLALRIAIIGLQRNRKAAAWQFGLPRDVTVADRALD